MVLLCFHQGNAKMKTNFYRRGHNMANTKEKKYQQPFVISILYIAL